MEFETNELKAKIKEKELADVKESGRQRLFSQKIWSRLTLFTSSSNSLQRLKPPTVVRESNIEISAFSQTSIQKHEDILRREEVKGRSSIISESQGNLGVDIREGYDSNVSFMRNQTHNRGHSSSPSTILNAANPEEIDLILDKFDESPPYVLGKKEW